VTLIVVKVGGSLSKKPEALRTLCQKLSLLAQTHKIVVVPGGGEFADYVREIDKRFSLSATVAHRMAILAMDQYGLLLSELTPNCKAIDSLEEAKNSELQQVTVFLPSKFMLKDDGLPNSWDVTSDSIAAYIAGQIGADKLLLVKDVDGIFTDNPKHNQNAKLLNKVTVCELAQLNGKTCVDSYLPQILGILKIECCIVNGFYPERVEAVLTGKQTVGTCIWREFL
jgi:aspartokinase-like uncharacterized kinase